MIYGNKFLNYGVDTLTLENANAIIENDLLNIDSLIANISTITESDTGSGFIEKCKMIINKLLEIIAKGIAIIGKLVGKIFPKFKSLLQDIENKILSKTGGDFTIELSYYKLNDEPIESRLKEWGKVSDFIVDASGYIKSVNNDDFVNIMKNTEEIDKIIDKFRSEEDSIKKECLEKVEKTVSYNEKASELQEVIHEIEKNLSMISDRNKKLLSLFETSKSNVNTMSEFLSKQMRNTRIGFETPTQKAIMKLASIENWQANLYKFQMNINQSAMSSWVPVLKKLVSKSNTKIEIPKELENGSLNNM